MKRTIASLIAAATLLPTQAQADKVSDQALPTISGHPIDPNDPALAEYRWQRRHGAPPIRFWETIAHCETRQDWRNPGRWAGGLGIMTAKEFPKRGMGTWERWGGEQFAKRPNFATPLQQIVVANRIAMFGWEATYRRWNGKHGRVVQAKYRKYNTGFNGWGCIKMRRDTWPSHNPRRFEAQIPRPMLTYHVFQPKVPLAVPKYAKKRLPSHYLR